jgi:hypothetical protein
MEQKQKTILAYTAGAVLGALAGYLYYHFVGCASGTCPLVSRPLPATLYGSLLGLAVGGLFVPKKKTG